MKLDIVFRSCDRTDVHPERGPRFINVDKTTLVKKCFKSLINSIILVKDVDIRLWIVDDNSSDELITYFEETCITNKVVYNIEKLSIQGFNYSALRQFEVCRDKGREWVYSVEDDYLHFPDAITSLLSAGVHFSQSTGRHIAIRPDDDVFTYSPNTIHAQKPCRLFLGGNRHWRTLDTCHNTLFTSVNVFKDYWEIFAALAKYFKVTSINEDGTINTLWSDGATASGPVPLFSPIETLAIHISQNNEPPFVKWKELWESI